MAFLEKLDVGRPTDDSFSIGALSVLPLNGKSKGNPRRSNNGA